MPYTVPNQRTVNIHREPLGGNFLGINNENWMLASRILGAPAFRLYIYLAANADNYQLALSPAAIAENIGMARSTYHDQFMKLESLGYLVKSHGSTYEFYERPRNIKYTIPESTTTGHERDNNTVSVDTCTPTDNTNPQEDIEINNKYINNHRETAKNQQVAEEKRPLTIKDFVF